MPRKRKILFVCTHQGVRSRMAEALVNHYASGKLQAYSSNFDSGQIGGLAVEVMVEIGVPLNCDLPISIFDYFRREEQFDYVITLCHSTASDECGTFAKVVDTLFASTSKRLTWPIPDLRSFVGSVEERKEKMRKIRDIIRSHVIALLKEQEVVI